MEVYEEGDRVVNAWRSDCTPLNHGYWYTSGLFTAVQNPRGPGLVWQATYIQHWPHESSAHGAARETGLPFERDAFPNARVRTKESVVLEIMKTKGV